VLVDRDHADDLLIELALRLKARNRGGATAAKQDLMRRFTVMARRMRDTPEQRADESTMSPAAVCCKRALAMSDNGEDVTAFWSTLDEQLVAFVRQR
jgi:hypothetical protein